MLHRRLSILFVLVLAGCPIARRSTVDAGPRVDANTAHDAGSTPDTSVGPGDAGPMSLDAGQDAFVAPADAGRDAFVAPPDAGHDAFVAAPDAGHDAAVVTGPCTVMHMLISEVRTRGTGGAADEFVELYNPTSAAIVLDATYTLSARSTTTGSSMVRWTGNNQSVPAHGHFLITGTAYTQLPASNDALSSGITDASSVVLYHGATPADAICFAFDAASMALIDTTYVCEGAIAMNAHDNSTATNTDASLERRPGGAAGNCTDTGASASDFATIMPASPLDLGSSPTP